MESFLIYVVSQEDEPKKIEFTVRKHYEEMRDLLVEYMNADEVSITEDCPPWYTEGIVVTIS